MAYYQGGGRKRLQNHALAKKDAHLMDQPLP